MVVSEIERTAEELVVTYFKELSQYSSRETEKSLHFQNKSQPGYTVLLTRDLVNASQKRYRLSETARLYSYVFFVRLLALRPLLAYRASLG
jgi:hypothetical protein